MKYQLILASGSEALSLRSIQAADGENLRAWKNDHRFSFFFQDPITPEMQARWFQGYLERENDFMFIVQQGDEAVGCMGFRLIDGQADIYNVILGRAEFGGQGVMGRAMAVMCSYIRENWTGDIGCQVLQSNPAVNWYLKNGFYKVSTQDNYFELKLSPGAPQVPVQTHSNIERDA